MALVDRNLILRKLTEIDQYHEQIKEFTKISASEYAASWKTQRIVERTLQIMIEVCADIANHIVADKGFRTPKSYADTFQVLGEQGILSPELSLTMQDMAK